MQKPGKINRDFAPKKASNYKYTYLLIGLSAIVMSTIFIFQLGDTLIYDLIAVGASFLAVSAVARLLVFNWRAGGKPLKEDLLLLGGAALWFLAETAWMTYEVFLNENNPIGSFADAFWLIGYLFFAAYLVMQLIPLMRGHPRWKQSLSISLCLFSALLLISELVIKGVFALRDWSLMDKLIASAYIVGDFMLLALVMAIIVYLAGGSLTVPKVWVALSFFLFAVADTAYYYFNILDVYESGNLNNLIFNLAYLALAVGVMKNVQVLKEI
jgi:hypothetical protein